MSLMYAIVILVGLMIPARIRFLSYSKGHNGSDMTRDLIVKNIKDKKSSVLWKFLYIIIINLHTPVLFLMLFIGNSSFNLFNLGFMFFFIVFGASQWLYQRASILLPLFISQFILSQYFWSLVYYKFSDYNNTRDFLYMIDGWKPPADINQVYWSRLPNLKLWGLLFVMHALHAISQQFPDNEQNQKYVEECDKHIAEKFPTTSKWIKRVWNFFFNLMLVTVLFLIAKDLISAKPNFINLIYLILFTLTFGKMCSTSLDGNSYKRCMMFARYIKIYSAIVLISVVAYHLLVFEFYKLAGWLDQKRQERNFFVLNIEIFGFGIEESQTKKSVVLYTAYLIFGQVLESSFSQSIKQSEKRDLFDWLKAFKTPIGVARAANLFRFDNLFLVYKFFNYWPVFDFFCFYFHVLNNGIIVYFSVTVSISVFFAIHLSLIVFFYCYISFTMHHATHQKGLHDYDMQKATDLCRNYKKLSADMFLKLRQRLWMTQYAITLAFMFAGYLNKIIGTIESNAGFTDKEGLKESLKTLQFYMYWTGIYTPNTKERRIEGLMPIHIMFLFILLEKQAQNWLYSRWGLNKTLITKFAHLEFYLKLDAKGKQWLPQAQENLEPFTQMKGQEIMPVPEDLNVLPKLEGNRWLMEQFNIYMIFVWRSVKLQFLVKKAFQQGIKRRFTKVAGKNLEDQPLESKFTNEEYIDTMSLEELTLLEKELSKKLAIDLDLCSNFSKLKLKIEGEFCVLFLPIKEIVLEQMKKCNFIDLERVPFLSYSIVSTHRRNIHLKLNLKFLTTVQDFNKKLGIDISKRVENQKQNYKIQHLKRKLMKIVNRRYSYEMWGGLRLAFEQLSLMLLLCNVIIKCNIVSLIYLILVTNYLLRHSKQRAMRNMVYVIGTIFIIQYWIYLMNLTSQSSPTPFPEQPYPNKQYPQGKYLIPIMYKFQFGRVMQNAFWYSFGVEIYTVRTLWIDFITLVLVSIYLYYYRNPVLSIHAQSFYWEQKCQDNNGQNVCCFDLNEISEYKQASEIKSQISDGKFEKSINFCKNLDKYHQLMVLKYPQETEYRNNQERLREFLDSCPFYLVVTNGQILIFTTMHIFTMIVILLMALCRRSLVSIGYVLAVAPCLWESGNVLKQHENYVKCERELKEKEADPEFQKYPENQQRDILKYIKKKYEWSFIKRICIYLSLYSYLDYVTQVIFQVPYIPDYEFLEHFGIRKVYPPHVDSFDYSAFISGNYVPPRLNMQNFIMQILNCFIVCIISTQSELFKSKGFQAFITQPNYGLDLLMKLSDLKKWALTYDYNNKKLTKILLIQRTEQQIFGTVDRLRLNAELYRKAQQRAMLEEYCLKYGGMYIPPNPQPSLQEIEQYENSKNQSQDNFSKSEKDESDQKELENQRIEKLVADQTANVTSKLLPFRATIYIRLMKFSKSYIFLNRWEDMNRIKIDMENGQEDNAIDLIRIIRSDLLSQIKRIELESGQILKEWPQLALSDLRLTNSYCKWSNIIPRQLAAIFRAIISNTALISYFCMLMSLRTNAGLVSLLYPFVVFGYALLEETRPGKFFWRCMLGYSLAVLFLKYVMNLNLIHMILNDTDWPLIDGFIKFGLHHLETTKDLVWHMLPEMLIVLSILCHEIIEQITGLFEKSESQLENVSAAIARIFQKHNIKSQDQNQVINDSERIQIVNSDKRQTESEILIPQTKKDFITHQTVMSSDTQPILSRASLYPQMKQQSVNINQQDTSEYEVKDTVRDHLQLKLKEIKSSEELVTLEFNAPIQISNKDDELKKQVLLPSESDTQLKSQNTIQVMKKENKKKSFWDSDYIQRIFPKIQQQKPGTDLYLWQTAAQIYIIYYLMNNFSTFSASGPYQEENLFQAELTVVLFYNLACVILERIIARTENRQRVERFKKTSEALKPHIKSEELFMPVQHNDLTVRLVIQKLKFQHIADQQHVEPLSKLRYQQDCEIIESESMVTIQQKGKLILHWVNLFVVHAYIFWYLPIRANITLYGEPNCSITQIYGCKDFRSNESLQTLYLLYLLHFFISASQISLGLPSFRRGSSMMYYEGGERDDTEEDISNALFQIFINVPLVAEIRCLLDFAFTRTALDLWQTCQLFQFNADLFIAKTGNLSYNRKIMGVPVNPFPKIVFGYICTAIMLFFILGPFLMFSSIGGMTLYNPVINHELQFWVQVNTTKLPKLAGGNKTFETKDLQSVPFKLYDNESPLINDFDETLFKQRHFDQWPETKFFEPTQLQTIVPTYFSDTSWIASDSTRALLQKYACIASIQSTSNEMIPKECDIYRSESHFQNVSIGFQIKTKFSRNGPAADKDAFGIQQRNLNADDAYDRVLLSQFSQILSERCSDGQQRSYTMNITNFYFPKLLLGETSTVEPIYFNTRETAQQAIQNLLLTYKCKDQWAIGTGSSDDPEPKSLEFTVFNQKIVTEFLQGYSISSFYTGFILIIGMYFRPIFIYLTDRAFICEINYPDPMLRLCEAIHLCRARGDLQNEEENWRLLQDILRKPDLLHSLTGSNLRGGDYATSEEERRAHLIPKAYGSQPGG